MALEIMLNNGIAAPPIAAAAVAIICALHFRIGVAKGERARAMWVAASSREPERDAGAAFARGLGRWVQQ